MANARSSISGFKESAATLRGLKKATQNAVGRRSMFRGAEELAGALRQKTPVSSSPYDKTPGSLRDNTKAVKAKAERRRPTAAVLIDDVAAVPMEFGTSKMPPHPYAKRAERGARDTVGAVVGDALKDEIEAAARRVAAKQAKG